MLHYIWCLSFYDYFTRGLSRHIESKIKGKSLPFCSRKNKPRPFKVNQARVHTRLPPHIVSIKLASALYPAFMHVHTFYIHAKTNTAWNTIIDRVSYDVPYSKFDKHPHKECQHCQELFILWKFDISYLSVSHQKNLNQFTIRLVTVEGLHNIWTYMIWGVALQAGMGRDSVSDEWIKE